MKDIVQEEPAVSPPPSRVADRRPFNDYLIALGFFTLVGALYLWPVWRTLATAIGPDLGDPVFNLCILKWDAHQLSLGLPDLWNPTFLYPTPGVLAFSDHLLGPALQFWLLEHLGCTPLAAFNILFLAAYILTPTHLAWVLRRTGRSWTAALVAGLAYGFCSFRWAQAPHLQVVTAQWLPLLFWTWHRLLRDLSPRRAATFFVFYALQVGSGTYLAYMLHLPLLVFAVLRRRQLRAQLRHRRRWATAVCIVVACGLVAGSVFYPYWRVAREQHLERHEAEYRGFGATLASFVTPTPRNWYWHDAMQSYARPENELFLGFLPSALAGLGLLTLARRRRPRPPLSTGRRAALAAALGFAGFGFLLGEWRTLTGAKQAHLLGLEIALGGYRVPLLICATGIGLALWWRRRWRDEAARRSPLAGWDRGLLISSVLSLALTFPLVMVPLARFLPGLGGMRVPARFIGLAAFGFALLAAIGAERLAGRCGGPARRAVVALLLAAIVAEHWPRLLDWQALPQESALPAADRWLVEQPDLKAILYLPLARVTHESDELPAMLRWTNHWRPIANGYSGYLGEGYLALRETITPLPGPEDMALLRRLGITHVVVRHAGLRARPALRHALNVWRLRVGKPGGPELALVHVADGDLVYRVLAAGEVEATPAAPASGDEPRTGRGEASADGHPAVRRRQRSASAPVSTSSGSSTTPNRSRTER